MAAWAESGLWNSQKPKPLERPVSRSWTILDAPNVNGNVDKVDKLNQIQLPERDDGAGLAENGLKLVFGDAIRNVTNYIKQLTLYTPYYLL